MGVLIFAVAMIISGISIANKGVKDNDNVIKLVGLAMIIGAIIALYLGRAEVAEFFSNL